jgi:hypothetical protein
LPQKLTKLNTSFPDLSLFHPAPLFAIMSESESFTWVTEATEQLEGKQQTQWRQVNVFTRMSVTRDPQFLIGVDLKDDSGMITSFSETVFDHGDELFDEWRRFGIAVQNCTLHQFWMDMEGTGAVNSDLLVVAARCMNAFFAEAKYNESIVTATIELTGLSMDDVSYFIRNNEALKTLVLKSRKHISLEESTASRAIWIGSVQLESVNIQVIRKKILRYYFVGEFDVSSLSSMAVSVLPEVEVIKLSAIYRLLKCIPDLCNVSDRVPFEQDGNKRLKTI